MSTADEAPRFLPLTKPQAEELLAVLRRNPPEFDMDKIMPRAEVVKVAERFAESYFWLLEAYFNQGRIMLSFAASQGKI